MRTKRGTRDDIADARQCMDEKEDEEADEGMAQETGEKAGEEGPEHPAQDEHGVPAGSDTASTTSSRLSVYPADASPPMPPGAWLRRAPARTCAMGAAGTGDSAVDGLADDAGPAILPQKDARGERAAAVPLARLGEEGEGKLHSDSKGVPGADEKPEEAAGSRESDLSETTGTGTSAAELEDDAVLTAAARAPGRPDRRPGPIGQGGEGTQVCHVHLWRCITLLFCRGYPTGHAGQQQTSTTAVCS